MLLRLILDPVMWILVLLVLAVLAEGHAARSQRTPGSAMLGALLLLTLMLFVRWALSPVWFSDLIVGASGLVLIICACQAVFRRTGRAAMAAAGSATLILPVTLMAGFALLSLPLNLVLHACCLGDAGLPSLQPLAPPDPWRWLLALLLAGVGSGALRGQRGSGPWARR